MGSRLPIPAAALNQHGIVLGKTGAGKSSKLRVLVEYLLGQERPVCIIDPKGDWWGLKSSADGKSSGFPIVIFGGAHADVPINQHAGAHVAELVATGNRSCLIDLGEFMVGERTRFFLDFAAALFRHARGARHLVIDEVHNFAPKGKVFDPDAGKALHWANRLASEGRGKGITLLAASQRPQKVHNDFLTSCETLIACRVIHKADRDAIKDWIDGCADPAAGRAVLAELAAMQRPDAWVWSPEIGFGPERITFPLFQTYDSFKPQAADAGKLKGWAAVDLEEVRAKLASVVEEHEANDPAKLKRRIRELEAEVGRAAPAGPSDEEIERRVSVAVEDALAHAAEQAEQLAAARAAEAIAALRSDARPALDTLVHVLANGWQPPAPAARAPAAPVHRPRAAAPPPAPRRAPAPRASRVDSDQVSDEIKLGGTPQRMLDAMAMLAELGVEQPTQATVAGWVGISSETGTWRNYLSELRKHGLVEDHPGKTLSLTGRGRAIAQEPDSIPTRRQLHDTWKSKMGGTQGRMLEVLIAAYPKPVTKDELGAAVGISPETGTFRNYLSDLRRPGIVRDIARGGPLVATELLFPKGLR